MKRRSQRRGILLLIVLSLLVLFVLIGVTFVVVATQYTRAAKISAKRELKGDDPNEELDGALYLLMRGTSDPASLLHRHSLLGDLYGEDGFTGTVINAIPQEPSEEFVRLVISYPTFPRLPPYYRDQFFDPNDNDLERPPPGTGYYEGSVLTFVSGRLQGRSGRVVRYSPGNPSPGDPSNAVPASVVITPIESKASGFSNAAIGDRFVINGKPFNGTGDGLAPTGELNEVDPAGPTPLNPPFPGQPGYPHDLNDPTLHRPLAMLPNYRQSELRFWTNFMGLPEPLISLGGTDESWDAPDFQNFHLARIPITPQTVSLGPPRSPLPPTPAPFNDPLIPSFHRPFLINYWMFNSGDTFTWEGRDEAAKRRRRMVIARPLMQDHPFFTGSNPAFSHPSAYDPSEILIDPNAYQGPADDNSDGFIDMPITRGPWDVDNDNDGIPDSIWVDLGMPAKTAADGRRYKPLFAILCIDLDGRLNVNAHDSREQPLPLRMGNQDATAAGAMGPTGTTPTDVFPIVTRGQGYGPAEIRLADALSSDPAVSVLVRASLVAQRLSDPINPILPPFPGAPGVDLLTQLKHWGTPGVFRAQDAINVPITHLTPADLKGLGGVYLDLSGHPRFLDMNANEFEDNPSPYLPQNQVIDNPYETNLVTPNTFDRPFSVNDLEHLYRFADTDTMALPRDPGSLRAILAASPELLNDARLLRRFTTRSFDIPTPNVLPTTAERELESGGERLLGVHVSLADLVRARLTAGGFIASDFTLPNGFQGNELELMVQVMLPTEIRNGQRLDLNRWLGNAIDDSGNLVVDEPGEFVDAAGREPIWTSSPYQAIPAKFARDPRYPPPNPVYTLPHFSRQVQARHLYCMMMLLMDPEFAVVDAPNLTDRRQLTARRIAQWAINVIDFRDPDVAMTPFEFDLNPFDGWHVDGNFTTTGEQDRAVVWGCEHPELVMSETAAFHDRRVRDTNDELVAAEPDDPDPPPTSGEKRVPPPNPAPDWEPDRSLDQYRVPQGSLFVELYNVRNRQRNNSVFPRDLYNEQGELHLSRLAEDRSPVWRIAIAKLEDLDLEDLEDEASVVLPALPPDLVQPHLNQFPNDEGLLSALRSDGIPDNKPGPTSQYERFIIFSRRLPTPGADVPDGVYYFNRGRRESLLKPGQYAVVGPYRPRTRQEHAQRLSVTALGSKKSPDMSPATNQGESQDNTNIMSGRFSYAYQEIQMSDTRVAFQSMDRRLNSGPQPVVGIMVSAPIIDTRWSALPDIVNRGIGISVSEPLPNAGYYRPPVWGPSDPGWTEYESYYADVSAGGSGTLPDIPLDNNEILGAENKLATGTYTNFRVAVLQRLADPNRAWNAITNPYISIDAQPIDLTVFSGEEDTDQTNAGKAGNEPIDPDDPAPDDPYFETRERGTRKNGTIFEQAPNIWNPVSEDPIVETHPVSVPNVAINVTYWRYQLRNTLGYLNDSYKHPSQTIGSLTAPPEYRGDPVQPFPWLVWNNRPYASNLELLQVPSSAPWRLLYEFQGGVRNDLYGTMANDAATSAATFVSGFPHLLNFFHSDESPGSHANLCRFLDFVEVPSRYVGTEKWLSPNNNQILTGAMPPPEQFLDEFVAPFNKISMFRDPGRVNVNTIPDQIVWRGIDPGVKDSNAWNRLVSSLRGEGDINLTRRPAYYTNPVRSSSSAALMPIDDLKKRPVDATLLRSVEINGQERPLFDFESPDLYDNAEHNSYFRYHKLQRLGNLLTTHSNVYAIWITVGYFEVHPWNRNFPGRTDVVPKPDPVHPDGYQLGLELGSDTGEIKRHRAFYIIDRSVPVAYEPGENHNVDKAVLLRRIIE